MIHQMLTADWICIDIMDSRETVEAKVKKTPNAKVWVSNNRHLTRVRDNFLWACASVAAVEFSPQLGLVTVLENGFLGFCSQLTSLDLTALVGVLSVGDLFLARCDKLKSLDLSPLAKVTKVGDWFLADCTQLASLDLSALVNVTEVKDRFLSDCINLTTIDLRPLGKVTKVGAWFLCGCDQLHTVITPGQGILLRYKKP